MEIVFVIFVVAFIAFFIAFRWTILTVESRLYVTAAEQYKMQQFIISLCNHLNRMIKLKDDKNGLESVSYQTLIGYRRSVYELIRERERRGSYNDTGKDLERDCNTVQAIYDKILEHIDRDDAEIKNS